LSRLVEIKILSITQVVSALKFELDQVKLWPFLSWTFFLLFWWAYKVQLLTGLVPHELRLI
jgi:hypothetical protein